MDQKRIEQLLAFHRAGLLENTIPFWLKYAIDKECGGFFNYIDYDGSVIGKDKPVWVQCRFTWLLSMLYNNVEKKTDWLELAGHGLDFIRKHCFDTDGRMFFEVTRDGRPIRKRRYVFTEAFGVLAFSEYALAAKDEQALESAEKLYKLLIHYYHNPELLPPKEYPHTRRSKSHAMPMIMLAVSQQIRKASANQLYEDIIDASLKEVFEDFMHYDVKALLETVGQNGEILEGPDGRCVNPGHAIETSWFIMEESRVREDRELLEKASLILDWSLDLGWDEEFEGIKYFVDIEGKPPLQYEHDMKLWWPHNESLYACLLAYYLTGKKKYADWYERIHKYAYSHFPDAKNGEWFKYLHRDGTVSSTIKGNRWAGPFHLPRMQFNCWKLLEQMKRSFKISANVDDAKGTIVKRLQ
jgi:N-acylglucosamine 2-epimerase